MRLIVLMLVKSFHGFVQSASVKASLLPQNASIIPDSYTYIPIMIEIMLA